MSQTPKTSSKDINKILKEASRQDWTFKRGSGGHFKCYSPNGNNIVTVSVSPSNDGSTKKVAADFKRAGLKYE